MRPRERVLACVRRGRFDRLPVRHLAVAEVDQQLREHFGVSGENDLLDLLGHDFREIRPRYTGPAMGSLDSEHGVISGVVMARAMQIQNPAAPLPLAGIEEPTGLDRFAFPLSRWYDYGSVPPQCGDCDDYAQVLGYCEGDFINGLSGLRGMEQVLVDIATRAAVFVEIVERRAREVHEHLRLSLEAGGGRIDILHLGEDLGSQKGLLLSPASFMELFGRHYAAFIELAHRHGALAMNHVCGSVVGMIPTLIDLGLDILDVVQTNAEGMELSALKREFGDRLVFAGTMCVQRVLPFGTPAQVLEEVHRRQELFADGGLIFGPSHQMQADTPLSNILEMYRAVGGLAR
jgi:uroporphyrinogen decarboxylase